MSTLTVRRALYTYLHGLLATARACVRLREGKGVTTAVDAPRGARHDLSGRPIALQRRMAWCIACLYAATGLVSHVCMLQPDLYRMLYAATGQDTTGQDGNGNETKRNGNERAGHRKATNAVSVG